MISERRNESGAYEDHIMGDETGIVRVRLGNLVNGSLKQLKDYQIIFFFPDIFLREKSRDRSK